MKIKTMKIIAVAALLVGSSHLAQAQEGNHYDNNSRGNDVNRRDSNRPKREGITKRFDKDGDGKLSEKAAHKAIASRKDSRGRSNDRRDSNTRGRYKRIVAYISSPLIAGAGFAVVWSAICFGFKLPKQRHSTPKLRSNSTPLILETRCRKINFVPLTLKLKD